MSTTQPAWDGTAPDSAVDTAVALWRSAGRLVRRLRAEQVEGMLSAVKMGALERLRRDGPLTASALAGAEHMLPQSLTRVLADLERLELIERRRNPDDRRQHLIELTAEGQEVLRADRGLRARWLASAMRESLSPTEQEVLRLAAQLMDRLAET